MIKIIATITDCGMSANIGGDPIRRSEIIDIPTQNIPPDLKRYLENPEYRKWSTLSFSLLKENTP